MRLNRVSFAFLCKMPKICKTYFLLSECLIEKPRNLVNKVMINLSIRSFHNGIFLSLSTQYLSPSMGRSLGRSLLISMSNLTSRSRSRSSSLSPSAGKATSSRTQIRSPTNDQAARKIVRARQSLDRRVSLSKSHFCVETPSHTENSVSQCPKCDRSTVSI